MIDTELAAALEQSGLRSRPLAPAPPEDATLEMPSDPEVDRAFARALGAHRAGAAPERAPPVPQRSPPDPSPADRTMLSPLPPEFRDLGSFPPGPPALEEPDTTATPLEPSRAAGAAPWSPRAASSAAPGEAEEFALTLPEPSSGASLGAAAVEVEGESAPQLLGAATRLAPVPYELLMEPALPPPAEKPKGVITRHPPLPPLDEPPPVLRLPPSAAEQTMIDLAAALGMAPAPPPPRAAPAPPAVAERERPEPLPLPLDEAPPPRAAETPRREKERATRARASAGAHDLQRMVLSASTAAKVIPLILGAFVVLATVVISANLLRSQGKREQAFVELRFMSLRGAGMGSSPSKDTTRISLETRPEGVLVLHEREILGKTPLLVDLPVKLEDRVGVELSGPHFERAVTEVTRTPGGEYHLSVDLVRRR